jgi:hypothetical protein
VPRNGDGDGDGDGKGRQECIIRKLAIFFGDVVDIASFLHISDELATGWRC